jgi:hypothetical protein
MATDDTKALSLMGSAIALRWAADDLVTAALCFRSAGIPELADQALDVAVKLTDLAHDIYPAPTTEDT